MERAIVVSADGHASMPPELWEHYLEPAYHEWLPQLRDEFVTYRKTMVPINMVQFGEQGQARFDNDRAYADERWRRSEEHTSELQSH